MSGASYQPLDAALDRLADCGSDLVNGNFNHAPMVAEALCALGRPEAVLPWVERYRPRIVPRGPVGAPIAADRWSDELGRRERFPAWSAFFADALRDAAWRPVLALWVERLAPGVSAAATHGAIRVGHAVRALTIGETAARRRELADALASWAASYSELPTVDGRAAAALPPRAAIARVPIVPPERRPAGNIDAALRRLAEELDFAPVIGLADLGGDTDSRLVELTELFARVYLANARNPLTAIVFIHGVTSLKALGHIAVCLDEPNARRLLRYGWQAGCGLLACFGGGTAYAADVAAPEVAAEVLIDRAIANGDEHVIKFAEACLAGHRHSPSPAYPAAVASALTLLPRR